MQITLIETCGACPEQYDAFDETGKQVGYLRLRHGSFTVDCPDAGDTQVYKAYPNGDGIFEDDERDFYLDAAKKAIDTFYLNKDKYIVAYFGFFHNELHQVEINATSELEAAKQCLAEKLDITEIESYTTLEELKDQCFDWDIVISVYKL